MGGLFSALYGALYSNPGIAVLAAFVWGILSIVLSPCHLSGIPLIIGIMTGKRNLSPAQAFKLSTVFSVGILLSIMGIGGVTILMGRMLGDLGAHANLIFGILIMIGGILLLDILPLGSISFVQKLRLSEPNPGTVLIAGLLFGLTLGPCAFAFMAPLLTLVISIVHAQPILAAALILAYAIGHVGVITVGGASISMVQKILDINSESRLPMIIKRVCAGLVIFAGIYLIFK